MTSKEEADEKKEEVKDEIKDDIVGSFYQIGDILGIFRSSIIDMQSNLILYFSKDLVLLVN